MKQYIPRIIDHELEEALKSSGAVLIKGAKACGKTQTAKQHSKSFLQVDIDPQVSELMAIDPSVLLVGETPRLIDEWQVQPKLWNYIRHEVDNRSEKGQFIMTGSANPEETASMHSGAGRFIILKMRTMSWQELGYSDGYIKLDDLIANNEIETKEYKLDIHEIIHRLVVGGWPELAGASEDIASRINSSYIQLLSEVDMSRVSGIKRDPAKVKYLLQSLARNISTITEISTFRTDIQKSENEDISRPTISDYLDTLERLMISEDQPAWNIHIRSSAKLRKTPKRHFADASLAIASLGLNSKALFEDLRYTGFLFESQVIHDLRVYAQRINSEVYYYRDSQGLEVDAIVQTPNGDSAAFEIKLGEGYIEQAATNLKKFSENIINSDSKKLTSLNVITGSGYAYKRPDGVNVIPIGALGI